MLVGLIGKPNTGKSSFFSAATLIDVPIANYPFTTIQPNVGIAYVLKKCVHEELGINDNPKNSLCISGVRHIPVKLVDVAGLIPDASKGLGLGNKFLDELRRADALIHVVDASGSTDKEGKAVEPGSHDPAEDVVFVEREYDYWMAGIIRKDWEKISHLTDQSRAFEELLEKLAGLGVGRADLAEAMRKVNPSGKRLQLWTDEDIMMLAVELRKLTKPILIAANKCDLPEAEKYISKLQGTGRLVIPTSAAAELLLKKASQKGLIEYMPGSSSFKIRDESKLTPEQLKALRSVEDKVLKKWGSTGVQKALNEAYFSLLGGVVVYPVEDENKFSDRSGNVLPDAYIMPRGSTAKDLAYRIHTELGEGFLYAIDAKRKQRLSAEYILKDGDVIRIVSTAKRG
ncbi:MAG: redox-regulated ATPase YchF [Conexivisphaerales archaeon]